MPSTQDVLQFDYIRDDVIVLKSGDLRAILRATSVNFGLKSQEEQEALVYAFQNFLNSLDFDMQIVIHSQRININPYLDDLGRRAQEEESDLLRTQIEEYIEFIRSFVAETNVMTKNFYLVVPYSLLASKRKAGVLGALPAILSFTKKQVATVKLTDPEFLAARNQLLQRVEFVTQNLAQINLGVTMLRTDAIVEFLWRLYNPEQREAGAMPQIPSEAYLPIR